MEAKSKCWEKVEKVEEEDDDEVMVGEHDILKRRISSHPLYGLLVEAHLGCLKVGDIGELYINHSREQKQPENNASFGMANRSELDQFMEAYCIALAKLKEAMEEPQQKSMAFIKNMHSQLEELTSMHPVPAEHDTTSGE
nr:homeobox protein knotted-1-like 1 [Quercus suber]